MQVRLIGVPLIPQTQDMACWYASAQMLITWRRQQRLATEQAHPEPQEVPQLQAAFTANHGLGVNDVVVLAKALGLTPVPPMTPTPQTIANWLTLYGPLWFAGIFQFGAKRSGHAVVITGINDNGLFINDPWPPHVGRQYQITYDQFGGDLVPLSSGPVLPPNLLYFGD